MMAPRTLAEDIKAAIGQKDKPLSDQTLGEAKSIIDELVQNGTVTNAPGTVTGAALVGSKLQAGEAKNGKITQITGSSLADRFVKNKVAPKKTKEVADLADSIINHITKYGNVVFAVNQIAGTCTNTPTAPGPLLGGTGTGGKVTGLDGDKLAEDIGGKRGKTTDVLRAKCRAIVKHIEANCVVTYSSGTVFGTAPASGGMLLLGGATGGKLS